VAPVVSIFIVEETRGVFPEDGVTDPSETLVSICQIKQLQVIENCNFYVGFGFLAAMVMKGPMF
jgi:hypothetical protein